VVGGRGLSRRARRRRGASLAALLAGSWRDSPPAIDGIARLDELAPLLHRTGSAALAWSRLRRGAQAGHPAAAGMQQAHRHQTLRAALHRRHVAHVAGVFRAHGVEPILIKGWAAARLYPEEGLRPTGDVDLCVRPEEEVNARRALAAVTEDCSVDLHLGLAFLDDRAPEEVRRRSEQVTVEGVPVRVLGREDHLRLLAVHMFGHGAWRPVWLADIAVALETRPPDFDWEWFRSGSPRRTEWALAAVRLAHALLGAALDGVPADVAHGRLPSWIPAAVLQAWGDERPREPQGARLPMRHLRHPFDVLHGLRRRWPGPLEAAMGVGAPVSSFPRWPIQLAECVVRVCRFARTLMRERGVRSAEAALTMAGRRG
jgi:hypothetical protein